MPEADAGSAHHPVACKFASHSPSFLHCNQFLCYLFCGLSFEFRAITKLERKSCDLIVLNGPEAMTSDRNSIELLNPQGQALLKCEGAKTEIAKQIIDVIERQLIEKAKCSTDA